MWQDFDHPSMILIVGGSGSGKTNALLNIKNHQPDINRVCLYAKDLYESPSINFNQQTRRSWLKIFEGTQCLH